MARDKRYGTEREVKAFSMFAQANVLVLTQQPNGSFLASPFPHITLPGLGAMTKQHFAIFEYIFVQLNQGSYQRECCHYAYAIFRDETAKNPGEKKPTDYFGGGVHRDAMMSRVDKSRRSQDATMMKQSAASIVGPLQLERGHVVKAPGEAHAASHGHVKKLDDSAVICVVVEETHKGHYLLFHMQGSCLTSAYARELLECLKHPTNGKYLMIDDAYNM